MPNWLTGMVKWAKANRGTALLIGGGVLVLLVFLLTPGGDDRGQRQVESEADLFEGEALPGDATTAKSLREMQVSQEKLAAEIRQLRADNGRLRGDLALQRQRIDAQDRTYMERLDAALERSVEEIVAEIAARGDDVVAPPPPAPPRLRILRAEGPGAGPATGAGPASPPVREAVESWVHLPAGSLVAGEIVTGAFATKVRGDGLPVLARLETAYVGPNETEIPLAGCLVIGKATADVQSVRARVEAVTLSCVLEDGTPFDRRVRGYFTGDDGTLGVPGRWVMRSGAWAGNLLAALGVAAGGMYGSVKINEALQGADVVLGERTLETTEKIEDFFLERAEEILPVVWVETNTPVYVVMMEGVTIEGMPEIDGVPVAAVVAED